MDLKDQKFGIEIELTGSAGEERRRRQRHISGHRLIMWGRIMTPMRQRTDSSGNGNS